MATRRIASLALLVFAAPPLFAAPHALPPVPEGIVDLGTHADANELDMVVTNVGSLGFDQLVGDAGLEWPAGEGTTVVFASGLWLGAMVGGDLRVAVSEFSTEYAAGPLDSFGVPLDPFETHTDYRVLKVEEGDGPSNPDYILWKQQSSIEGGPPVDGAGEPLLIGEQALWCWYNDAVAAKHSNGAGSTAPLGVEVRQHVFGYDVNGALEKMYFVKFEIANKSSNLLEDMYMSFWFDPDLGGFGDDLVGCDPPLDMGYVYNSGSNDTQFGVHPPAVGCKVLDGLDDGGTEVRMTAFNRLINGTDPNSAIETYRAMQGLEPNGDPQMCEGSVTRLGFSGDPVTGTGCLDDNPIDKRFMLSLGPVTMAPGDTQDATFAIIVGGESGYGDRLVSIELLRHYAEFAQSFHDAGYVQDNQYPVCDAGLGYFGFAGQPITVDGSASFDPDGTIVSYDWYFGDGTTGSGATATHVYSLGGEFNLGLAVTDDDGAISACAVPITIIGPSGLDFEDATQSRTSSAGYENIDETNRRALSWVNWGGRFFSGAVDTGCRWAGSTIVSEDEELGFGFCPTATLDPSRFGTIEIRFDGTQKGYRYLRAQLGPQDPGAPATGRGYTYAGHDDLPCTVWRVDGEVETQLQVMYTERAYTDNAGVPLPQQPESQDANWAPTSEGDGGREYLNILDVPYSGVPSPQFATDGIFFDGMQPLLYGVWVRLRGIDDVVDPADRFVIRWSNMDSAESTVAGAWADFVGDELPDFLIANDGEVGYATQNLGEEGWKEIASPIAAAGGRGLAWGDIDNDGDPDLFRSGPAARLYRNDGGGDFTETGSPVIAGLGFRPAATWTDIDLDGDLDLFVTGSLSNDILRNDDNGVAFTQFSGGVLGDNGNVASWVDYDDDGDQDVYIGRVGITTSGNRLLRNDGGAGAFVDVTTGALGHEGATTDVDWGDIDGDLDFDLCVTNAAGSISKLLQNDGGAFTDVTPAGLEADGFSSLWRDFDDDGDLDVYRAVDGPNMLLLNEGGLGFTAADLPVIADPGQGIDASSADIDADGDLDIFVGNDGPNVLYKSLLNDGQGTATWLHVELDGDTSNAAGVGARVTVSAGSDQQAREVHSSSSDDVAAFGGALFTQFDEVVVRWPSGIVQTVPGPFFGDRILVSEATATPVELARFEARGEVGRIVLEWEASLEVDHLGYHVWRAGGAGGDRVRLTTELIRGDGSYRFVDDAVEPGRTYDYELQALDRQGGTQTFGPVRGLALVRPLRFALDRNVPNPFNPSTSIGFEIAETAQVDLAIYDVRGRLVRQLVQEQRDPGTYSVAWDGRNENGAAVGSGAYFYRLTAGDRTSTRKMVLLR